MFNFFGSLNEDNFFDYYKEETFVSTNDTQNNIQEKRIIEKINQLQNNNNRLVDELKFLFKKIKCINQEIKESNFKINEKINKLESRIENLEGSAFVKV